MGLTFLYSKMKRKLIVSIVTLFLLLAIDTVSFAQRKTFFLPDGNADELSSFVGQKVKFPKPSNVEREHSAYVFQNTFGGKFDEVYTIKSIKGGKNYQVTLLDESGNQIVIKISSSIYNTKDMRSMANFFLVDKYEEERKKYLDKVLNNSEGLPVAKIIDVDIPTYSTKPSSITIKSDLDGSIVELKSSEEDIKKLCYDFGKILTHPMVKAKYKIVGVKGGSYNIAALCNYNVQNIDDPTDIRILDRVKGEKAFFAEDIAWSYKSSLTKVEKPSNPAIRYGKTTVQSEHNVSKFNYVDNVIDILILGGEKEFDFVLKNISDNSIKVIWNEAVFVGYDGSSSKIMHVGTKYSQRDGDQPPTVIIKGAKIDDCAIPNCNVHYINSDWVIWSMYPDIPKAEPIQLRLMLPIQIKDVVNEYVFIFEAKWSYDHPERLNLD